MQTETRNNISRYVELYDAIQEKTVSSEVAVAILQEIGKDRRSKIMNESKGDEFATEKQKDFLRDLGVEFSDSITRKEASDLIDQNRSC